MRSLWLSEWGGDFVVTRGRTHKLDGADGFIAEKNGEKLGLITYQVLGSEIEVTGIKSFREDKGIGTALVNRVVDAARAESAKRVLAITTNDNLRALGFWQKRGFRLAAVYPGVMDETRKLKPRIPLVGNNGIPLRDEIELEMVLQ